MNEGFVLVHMHIGSGKEDKLVESRRKSGYLVLWSEFNRKPMQFLREWCHMIVFGLSQNEFCSVVLDSVSVKSASMVILQGRNCSSQGGML